MSSAQVFDDRVAETQSGADEVQDFALRSSFAFPSADVLVPAPMTVSILGQLTLVATATDFKLVQPAAGFKHVRYPDSFRATIMQLVNSGSLALNKSFVNFDEIHKRCGAVRPGVNNIVQLLVGHEDNTPRQNEQAIERYLPNQIAALSKTIQACLAKAKETDSVFNDLLELTMEIHESCTATQGVNEGNIREADLRKAILDEEKKAAEEMKKTSAEALESARKEFANFQREFSRAAKSMPSAWSLAGAGLVDLASNICHAATGGLLREKSSSGPSGPNPGQARSASVATSTASSRDPGYDTGSKLRPYAQNLDALLRGGADGGPDWDAIKAHGSNGCEGVKVGLKHILTSVKPNHKFAGTATEDVIRLSKQGVELASRLGGMVPPGRPDEVSQLKTDVSVWHDEVIKFSAAVDLKLGTSQTSTNAFLPQPNYSSGSSGELATRSAQYRLAVCGAQLNTSREKTKAATDTLLEVTGQLGDILGQIAGLDVQKQNWQDIVEILRRAINFLCELKRYLNNLVHFFDAVNNLVSVTLKETADQFIQIVKDATAIDESGREPRMLGGATLDAFARQAIYNHALSTAKISRVVENISHMYVTLYDSNVHPGVNMLLGMGKLVGSNDSAAIAAAGQELQDWAKGASDKMVELVVERMHANEQDIKKRMRELEKTLGGILPQSPSIQRIVHQAEQAEVKEATQQLDASAKANPVFIRRKANVFV